MERTGFFYSGEMRSFKPKEYMRYFIVFNLFQKNYVRLVFPSRAKVNDNLGLLTGDYPDGCRLALFYYWDNVETKKEYMRQVLNVWLWLLDK